MLQLRPHHSLCMQFYVGKAYSPDFGRNMEQKLLLPEDTELGITFGLDDLCAHCPNHRIHDDSEASPAIVNSDLHSSPAIVNSDLHSSPVIVNSDSHSSSAIDICDSEAHVSQIDRRVANLFGYEEGSRMTLKKFFQNSREKIILSNRLEEMCGECDFMDICKEQAKIIRKRNQI